MNYGEILHNQLVDSLLESRHIVSPEVEAAFRSVPRHHFLPDVTLEEVYSDRAIVTQRQDDVPVSSSSQPAMMSIMLEQLGLARGDCVLEIGTATGYNAALMRHLVGPEGTVVTIDIDEELVKSARKHLAAAGVEGVHTICADGGYGWPENAPYDRIILTAGTWDVPPAWLEQLSDDGRLLVPMAIYDNYQESILFTPASDGYTALSHRCCAFVQLRGAFAAPESPPVRLPNHDRVTLHMPFEERGRIDPGAVERMLGQGSHLIDTGISVTIRELHHRATRWLGLRNGHLCTLVGNGPMADDPFVPLLDGEPGRVRYSIGFGCDDELLLLVRPPDRRLTGEDDPFELQARSYGPGAQLTRRILEDIVHWDALGRPCEDAEVELHLYPGTQRIVPADGERVFPKKWTTVVGRWRT